VKCASPARRRICGPTSASCTNSSRCDGARRAARRYDVQYHKSCQANLRWRRTCRAGAGSGPPIRRSNGSPARSPKPCLRAKRPVSAFRHAGQRSQPYAFHPSGGSHGVVPICPGTDTSRISIESDVRISLCRRNPGMKSESPSSTRIRKVPHCVLSAEVTPREITAFSLSTLRVSARTSAKAKCHRARSSLRAGARRGTLSQTSSSESQRTPPWRRKSNDAARVRGVSCQTALATLGRY
jgi:hypothetical protein